MLTRLSGVIISQRIQKLNHYEVKLKLISHVNYISIFLKSIIKKKEKATCQMGKYIWKKKKEIYNDSLYS